MNESGVAPSCSLQNDAKFVSQIITYILAGMSSDLCVMRAGISALNDYK